MFEFVSSFLNQADQQDSRAAVIMSLGAAEDFIRHFHFSGYSLQHFCFYTHSFFLFSNVFQYFFIPFTGVSSLLLQWLMLIQLKRCYCRGKCMHVHFLCYTCSSFTWIFIFYLCLCVLTRVIALVQRQMVMANFTQDFINKLQEFCKKLHFPAELRNMRNRYARPLTSRVTCYMYMLLL